MADTALAKSAKRVDPLPDPLGFVIYLQCPSCAVTICGANVPLDIHQSGSSLAASASMSSTCVPH